MTTTAIPRTPRAASDPDLSRHRIRSIIRGRVEDPAWARPLLLALLGATALAYLLNLTSSEYGNSFYAAAVQAGTKSWKAFLFGSVDASNFITVDKPPASLWVMELSGRIFGFSSASMLAPQVLEGVIAVGLLAGAVKRWFGAGAGLLAGALLAVTPVAALMFRFNNPDALLVCLLVASAYCLVRALEGASTRWLMGVGALLGFAFLAKMMQAFLVLPGFALVYMVAAPAPVRRRVGQLLLGGLAMCMSLGWWVALVALWPAGSRPMIDGSPDNNIFNLIFDYNGFSRLTGGTGGANFSGTTGLFRLFNEEMGSQASWLLPGALIVLVAGIVWRGRASRTDRSRAALLLWGSWLVVSAAVFSFGSGVIHTYYTVALAPAIAALVAIGASVLWRNRERPAAMGLAALIIAVTSGWALVLLHRAAGWESWLTPLIIVSGVVALVALLVPMARALPTRIRHRAALVAAVAAAIACLAGPTAYTIQTISTSHTGSTPSAGPDQTGGVGGGFGAGGFGGGGSGAGGFGGGGSGAARGSSGGIAGARTGVGPGTTGGGLPGAGGGATQSTVSSALVKLLEAASSKYRWAAATSGSQSAATFELASNGSPVMAIGGFNGEGGNITVAQFKAYVKKGDVRYYIVSGGGGGAGGFGSGLFSGSGRSTGVRARTSTGSSADSSAVSSLFGEQAAGASRPEGFGSGSSRGFAGAPGGGGGSFGGSAGGAPGSSSTSQSILSWVEAHYHSETVGGYTVYDLTDPK